MSSKDIEFFEECKNGNVSKLKQLIECGIDFNQVPSDNLSQNGTKMSALCVAAFEGQLEVVKFLISKSADVNHRCKNGETALFLAAQRGHAKIVQCLLDAGAEMVYTAKSGDNTIYKNWEVFSQPLRNAYPGDINSPENASYKNVAQILVEHNADSKRPSVMYEALFCELTVFANPIAVYCVGVYASLNGSHNTHLFFEENFLSAVCRAFHISRVSDFIATIENLLEASKPKQKDVALRLVKLFNWADLLRRLSEDQSRSAEGQKDAQKMMRVAKSLMNTLQLLLSNFNIRADLLEQFRPLSADDMARIGRLIKNLLDLESSSEEGSKARTDGTAVWQVLFFLLKHQLRTGQEQCVSRLLLRNPQATDYEKRILLRSLEDDLSLAHMLLDYGVGFSGECLLRSMQNGLLDLVNRFKSDRELLFCKEVEDLIRLPPTVKNSSNRNVRRCLKIIKSQRVAMEEERRRFEAELLEDISNDPKSRKRRRQRAKGRKGKSPPAKHHDDAPNDEVEASNDHEDTEMGDAGAVVVDPARDGYAVDGFGDHSDENISEKVEPGKGRKKRNKKKAGGKKKAVQEERDDEKESVEQQDQFAEILKKTTQQNRWSEIAVQTARRRRQSSSSSDCSIGAKKSVHFSHPLVFYENTSKKDPNQKLKHNGNAKPGASNLKQPIYGDTNISLTEAYRTRPSEYDSLLLENDFLVADGFNAVDAVIPWEPVSPRWAPRFEDLSEIEMEKLKHLIWVDGEGVEQKVFICDNQKHLHIGTGPDYSNIYLSLTSQGEEVAVKKVNSKRAPLLSQKGTVQHLLDLPPQVGLNRYISIVRDKGHCYVVQPVGEFSLDEVFRRKVAPLPIPAALGCHQLAEALHFLHQNDILHMAIKPNNVILCSNNELRFTDYGIHCRQTKSNQKQLLGPTSSSMCWMAREVLPGEQEPQFSPASDVASLGMLMYYIVTNGLHPFGDPDTLPAVCIGNITRGMYNLKFLADPFAHHLIRHMLFKDVEKRFTMSQVVAHPFLWTKPKKDCYLTLLMEKALSNAIMEDGSSVLEKLQTVEQEILKSYTHNKLVNVADVYTSSIRGLLTLMYDCAHNENLFAQCTKEEERSTMTTSVQYFRACYPGLLLSTYQLFTVESLERAAVPDAPSSPVDECPSGSFGEDDQENFVEIEVQSEPADAKSEESFEILQDESNEQQTAVVQATQEEDALIHQTQHPDLGVSTKQDEAEAAAMVTAKDKKNPSLCLSPCFPAVEAEVHGPPPSDLLSPETSESIIISEGEWTIHSSSSDQESDNLDNDAKRAPQLKMPPSGQIVQEVGSPEDWIEIGSPLTDEPQSTKADNDSSIGSSDSSPSSGCSVDECFDFGSYSKSIGVTKFVNGREAERKNVIDGDLCELFNSMDSTKQKSVAEELDRMPAEVSKKLEDIRTRYAFENLAGRVLC